MSDRNDAANATAALPWQVWNRPGRATLDARGGDHAAWLRAMLARLSATDLPALRNLRSRRAEDPAIALLDAAAAMADIVAFYNERITQEHYLRTAQERRSLVALARQVGHEPAPGLAATTWLAFTLESGDGVPDATPIPIGTRIQAVPPPGGAPAVFETLAEIAARPEWNAMRPLPHRPHPPLGATTERLRVAGLRPEIRIGDTIALVHGPAAANRVARRVTALRSDTAAGVTELDLAAAPTLPPPFLLATVVTGTFILSALKLTNAATGTSVLGRNWRGADLHAFARVQKWPLRALRRNLRALRDQRTEAPGTGAFRFARAAAPFGHNAPAWNTLPAAQRYGEQVKDSQGQVINVPAIHSANWDTIAAGTLSADATAAGIAAGLDLDDRYQEAIPGGWAVIAGSGETLVANITATSEVARSAFTVQARVTRLGLDSTAGFATMRRRATTIHLASENLPLAPTPITEPVAGNTLVLDSAYLGLEAGQHIAVSGPRDDLDGVVGSEVAEIAEVEVSDGLSVLTLRRALRHDYRRDECRINANLAPASHGEGRTEVLGGGDGRLAFQRFTLRGRPVTHLPAATGSGHASTLAVRVGGELWTQVGTLVTAGPTDRVYLQLTEDDGATMVQFGDGITGARLPSGMENVVATYRQGLGAEGLVADGTITLALTRPPGLRAVTNPEPSADAAAPDAPEDIRLTAPLHIRTLDRVVSLRDYEDFARAFAGIAKARATWSWDGQARGVFLTVAGPDGATLEPDGSVATALARALRGAGDPRVRLRIAPHRPAFFVLEGKLLRDPALEPATIDAALESTLRHRFGFAAREFGQPVAESEVLAAIHAVPGIQAVDLDRFERSDGALPQDGLLPAGLPPPGEAAAPAAELLLLDPRPLRFGSFA